MGSGESTKVNFLPQLELLCERHGLRQKDIAEIAGASKAAVSKWFNGAPLKVEYAAAIARHFEMSIEELAGLPDHLAEAREKSNLMVQESVAEADRYATPNERQLAFERGVAEKQRDDFQRRLVCAENERNHLLETLLTVQEQISDALKPRKKGIGEMTFDEEIEFKKGGRAKE